MSFNHKPRILLLRDQVDYLTDRYSERKQKAAKEIIAIANSALEADKNLTSQSTNK